MKDLADFKIFADLGERELEDLREDIKTIDYGKGEIIFQD